MPYHGAPPQVESERSQQRGRDELLRVIERDPARRLVWKPRTGPQSDLRSIWASRRAFTSPKRRSACTYMPMTTSASAPPGRIRRKAEEKADYVGNAFG